MTPPQLRSRRSTATTIGVLLAGLSAGLTGCATSSANPASSSAPAAPAGTPAATAVTNAAVATAAMAATQSPAPSTGESITLYNAQHKQTTAALVAAFTNTTGIAVAETDKDEDALTAQIEQEGDKSPADVFFTENTDFLQQLSSKKMLAKVDPTTLAGVPAADSAADGTWSGISERISALVYNPTMITPDKLPKSVLDMADPKYKGQFELAPGEADFGPVVASVAKAKGEDATVTWLKAMKDNAGSGAGVPDYETLVSDVSQGTTAFALVNHYYYYRLQAELPNATANAKLAYLAPQDPGYLATISGAGVLASSRHGRAAQKFLAFLTSDLGQSILATGYSFEYPLRAGVAPNPVLPPLSSYQPDAFSPGDLGDGEQIKDLLQKSGLI
jgi:iron(III) transport system substrate-binding protein